MDPLVIAAYLIALAIVAMAAFVVLNSLRTKGSVSRALGMQLFLITVPRGKTSGEQSEKELIAAMEQVYAAVATLKSSGTWNRFLYGDPYVALELAVHHIGEEIHFYAAVPRKYAQMFTRQLNGVFPLAQVEPVSDYNIFNPDGAHAGAYMTLKGDPVLPLRTYTTLASDPLGGIVTALSTLQRSGEGVAIQILARPCSTAQDIRKLAQAVARHMQGGVDFQKALKLAQHPPKKEAEKDATLVEPPKVATAFEEQVIKALQSKASRPLFDCTIRVVASAAEQSRAEQILATALSGFDQFAGPELNAFKASTVKGGALEKFVFAFSFRLFDHGASMPLSSEELTSIYHLPVAQAMLPRVKFAGLKAAEPPANLPHEGIVIGTSSYRGTDQLIRLVPEDRLRHFYIVGQTGTGKSVTMSAMIEQDLRMGNGVTVLDPNVTLAQWALKVIPKDRMDDVIYFNPADVDHPMGLNMLEYDTRHPEHKTLIVDELFEIFDRLYDLKTTGGPMFEKYFKGALNLLLDDYEYRVARDSAAPAPTLADISRVMVDGAFRTGMLEHESNPIVRQFWEQEASKTTGEQSLANFAPYISSKVDAFVANEFLRPIINQPKSSIDFSDIIENKRILICDFSKGAIGNLNAQLLGMVISGKLQRAAFARDLSRQAIPDHFVYMDEFQDFTTGAIATILSQARKYHLGLILAHQYIAQLPEDIKGAVFGNVGSLAVFRVSPEDAENPVLKTRLEPDITPFDVSNLPNHNCYVSMLVQGQVARPFNMRTMLQEVIVPISQDPERARIADAAREISRLRYTRPRAEVEAEIRERFTRSGLVS